MIPRRQLPVASPVSLRAVGAATVASLVGTASLAQARALVLQRWNAAEAVLTDSGTSALVCALRLAVPPGGIVAFPGYACIDLAAAALRAGTRVRLYDIDPATLSPDLNSVERVMRRGIDAIVVAHLFGYPADVDAVRVLAARHRVTIIEDAAQGAGATLHGRRLGSLGDLSILSFGRGKGLCAGGGGALLAHNDAWRTRVSALSLASPGGGLGLLARTAIQWMLGRPSIYRLPSMLPWLRLGEMVYHQAGEPKAISRASAALLPSAVKLEDMHMGARRRVAAALDERVRGAPGFAPVRPVDGSIPGYLRYAVLDVSGTRRVTPALGVVQPYPRTLAEQEELAPLLLAGEPPIRGAAALRRSLFTLPTHHLVEPRDLSMLDSWFGAGGR